MLDHSIHPNCSFSSKAPKSDSTFPLFKHSDPAEMQAQHMHPRVIAPLPKRASAATAHSAHWECLPTLNSVDWWLSIVTRKPGKVSFSEGQIVCFLERVCIEVCFLFLFEFPLYLTIIRHPRTIRYLSTRQPTRSMSQLRRHYDLHLKGCNKVRGPSWINLLVGRGRTMPLSGCVGRTVLFFSSRAQLQL
jgi:hypothetical protein